MAVNAKAARDAKQKQKKRPHVKSNVYGLDQFLQMLPCSDFDWFCYLSEILKKSMIFWAVLPSPPQIAWILSNVLLYVEATDLAKSGARRNSDANPFRFAELPMLKQQSKIIQNPSKSKLNKIYHYIHDYTWIYMNIIEYWLKLIKIPICSHMPPKPTKSFIEWVTYSWTSTHKSFI